MVVEAEVARFDRLLWLTARRLPCHVFGVLTLQKSCWALRGASWRPVRHG
jgi:hypothetical protein